MNKHTFLMSRSALEDTLGLMMQWTLNRKAKEIKTIQDNNGVVLICYPKKSLLKYDVQSNDERKL